MVNCRRLGRFTAVLHLLDVVWSFARLHSLQPSSARVKNRLADEPGVSQPVNSTRMTDPAYYVRADWVVAILLILII